MFSSREYNREVSNEDKKDVMAKWRKYQHGSWTVHKRKWGADVWTDGQEVALETIAASDSKLRWLMSQRPWSGGMSSIRSSHSRLGSKGHITFEMLKEAYPMLKKADAWPRDDPRQDSLVIVCNVDQPSVYRHGLPQCEVFQREAFKKKVPTHAPAITSASEEQKFHNELLSCLLLWAWPHDYPTIKTWEGWMDCIKNPDEFAYIAAAAKKFAEFFHYYQRNIMKCDVNMFLVIMYTRLEKYRQAVAKAKRKKRMGSNKAASKARTGSNKAAKTKAASKARTVSNKAANVSSSATASTSPASSSPGQPAALQAAQPSTSASSSTSAAPNIESNQAIRGAVVKIAKLWAKQHPVQAGKRLRLQTGYNSGFLSLVDAGEAGLCAVVVPKHESQMGRLWVDKPHTPIMGYGGRQVVDEDKTRAERSMFREEHRDARGVEGAPGARIVFTDEVRSRVLKARSEGLWALHKRLVLEGGGGGGVGFAKHSSQPNCVAIESRGVVVLCSLLPIFLGQCITIYYGKRCVAWLREKCGKQLDDMARNTVTP
eukprot:g48299.t1